MCSLVWFRYCSVVNKVLGFFFFFPKKLLFLANNPTSFLFLFFLITFSENYFFPKFTNEFANQLGERGGFCSTFRGVILENNPHNLPEQNVAVKKSHSKSTKNAQLYEVAKIRSYLYLYCFTYHSSFPLLCFLQVSHLCFFA